ncbi:hypothetical protein TWF694_002500 [Orbilia ellipsospora]|uniref:Uncharacterized protein n=1 Tax=Orbilia ellipsospora TaxID=2528407 RepID=A0AAV9X3J9_9PEZI
MKFLAALALLTAVSATPIIDAAVDAAAPEEAELERRCFGSWQPIGCYSTGSTGQFASTTSTQSGGGAWTWCTTWCSINAPAATYANLNSQVTPYGISSVCDCGTGPSTGTSYNPAYQCTNPCAHSPYTVAQCQDGSCNCGGPRAYTVFQKVQICK